MAYYEGSYKQLLFGVSQQARKDRLEGQVEAQINMTSDLTFGLRRRAAAQLTKVRNSDVQDWDRVAFAWSEVGGQRVLMTVDTVVGVLAVVSTTGDELYTQQSDYLIAPTAQDIVFTSVQDSVFVANTRQRPVEAPSGTAYPDPANLGFFFINSGGYRKEYTITISYGGTEYPITHTTGTSSEVAQGMPEQIAQTLLGLLEASADVGTAAGFTYTRTGAYVFVSAPGAIAVTSGNGSAYVRTSGRAGVPLVADLPSTLPESADGYIVKVGTGRVPVYYRWDYADRAWLEDAAWSAQVRPSNMPKVLKYDTSWSLTDPAWERRSSGDVDSNPTLQFLKAPLTGMTSFQGRLVLLAGDFVCMSASNEPERLYRSTVASLEADDPIEVAASSTLATPYRHGVQFNQDLVLFSEKYQATVPGRGALTPANASISISSTYTSDMGVRPVPIGLSLYFAAPRAAGYSGMWEMTPSPYSDTQLSAQDVTGHIPQYINSRVRFIATSTTTNILVVGDGKDCRELVIHEYLWTGAEKVHQSWHRWRFQHPVHYAYFDGDVLYLVCSAGARFLLIRVDIRAGAGDIGKSSGRLDYYLELPVDANGQITVPYPTTDVWLGNVPPAEILADRTVWMFHLEGDYQGMREVAVPVSTSVEAGTVYQTSAAPGTRVRIGKRYTSEVTPSAPVVRDRNDVPITTQRALLHKFVLSVQNTGEFTYQTKDHYRTLGQVSTSPLRFGSPELGAGSPRVANGTVHIPCRLDMQTTLLTLATDDVYDLNITSLEYGFKYHQRYGRRQ